MKGLSRVISRVRGRLGARGLAVPLARLASSASSADLARTTLAVSRTGDAEDLYRAISSSRPDSPERLMIVKIGGEVVQKELGILVDKVRQVQAAGMRVVIVHGGGPQLNEELAKGGVEPQYHQGHRITDAATMAIAERVFGECSRDIDGALAEGGLAATALGNSVFTGVQADGGRLGHVGEITGVDAGKVWGLVREGHVPVICSLASSNDGSSLNVNADVAARELARSMKPRRVVFVSAGGGWKEGGRVVPELSMAEDYERLEAEDYTGRQGTLLKLREVKAILDGLPPSSSVSICALADLPAQVVPHRGPGTQIRSGARAAFRRVGEFDPAAVDAALSQAHGVPTTADALADRHGGRVLGVVALGDGSAIGVVTETDLGPPHGSEGAGETAPPRLSALAVRRGALDTGSEAAVWSALADEFPELWWAARPAPDADAWAGGDGEAFVDCLTHHRAARYAVGAVRLTRDAEPVDAEGMTEEEQAELLARAALSGTEGAQAVPGLMDEGMFLPSGGGDGRVLAGKGLASEPTLMWWGVAGLFEVEDAVQTAQRARSRAFKAAGGGGGLAGLAPSHPADDVGTGEASAEAVPAPKPVYGSDPRRDIVLVGARGFTGRELITLLADHESLRVGVASSRAFAGRSVASALEMDAAVAARACAPGLHFAAVDEAAIASGAGIPDGVDPAAFVLALPNGLADPYHSAIRQAHPDAPVVDLSADKRFDDSWAYGMPERPEAREAIRGSVDISNPGCYATGVQVGLMPFLQRGMRPGCGALEADPEAGTPSAYGVSGYSGAGVNPSDKNDPANLRANLLPYSLVGHIHEREASRHLGSRVAFMPTVAPFFRGIAVTLSCQLADPGAFRAAAEEEASRLGVPVAQAASVLAARQASAFFTREDGTPEPLVRATSRPVDVRTHGSNCSGVTVGGFQADLEHGRLAWVSCLDNLGKGAAVQAIQNLNLALGLDELDGIRPDAALPLE